MPTPCNTCPFCRNTVTVVDDSCSRCGVHTFRIPQNCTPREAALHIEFSSKWWSNESQKASHEKSICQSGICWSSSLQKFIAVWGVRSGRSLEVARQYDAGDHSSYLEAPLQSHAIARADLTFIGKVPSQYKNFPNAADFADWLNSSTLHELQSECRKLEYKSKHSLPNPAETGLALILTVGSLGLGYKSLFQNGNREDAAETLESLKNAIRLKNSRQQVK